MSWSFPAGRLFGIAVRIHWTLPALSLFWLLQEKTGLGAAWTLAVNAVLWLTILIHELGHCWAAHQVGGHARQIVLWPLGGLAYVSHPGDLKDDIKVTLGGPLTHIPMAAFFSILMVAQGIPWQWDFLNPLAGWPRLEGGFVQYLSLYAVKIQVILFLFNMLVPAYPLDGGRLVACLLLMRMDRQRAARVIMILSAVAAVALLFMGELWIALFVLISTAQIYQLSVAHALEAHPMFARASAVPAARRSSGGGFPGFGKKRPKLKVVQGTARTCPDCGRAVPAGARMCGFCEKMLPGC